MKTYRHPKLFRYKSLLTKDLFEKEYIKSKKSISQLQEELKIDWNTIKSYLLFHKIPIRTHKEQATISSLGRKDKYGEVLTREFLIKEYINNKKGILDNRNKFQFKPIHIF